MVPDPRVQPVMTVEEVAKLLGLGRSTAYIEANRYIDSNGATGIPAIRVGSRLLCPTKLVLGLLGWDEAA